MRSRKRRGVKIFSLLCALALVFVLSVPLSVPMGAAVTVNVVVVDGEQTYTFPMESTDISEILREAERSGMPDLGPLDTAEWVKNTNIVNVRRGLAIRMSINGSDEPVNLTAYAGDTVAQTLERSGVILKETDSVSPPLETVVQAGMEIAVSRYENVTVVSGGQEYPMTLMGGDVAGALAQAGVTLGEHDSLNYSDDEKLFDKMVIQVYHSLHINVISDGEEREYVTSGGTVADALENSGVSLGEDDIVEPGAFSALEDGMTVTVRRVTKEEEKETRTVPYETIYEDDDSLYVDETELETEGVEGEEELTYQLTYVDGVEESRELISEEVTVEPVSEVILCGTKERPAPSESALQDYEDGTGGGTFVDSNGEEVSYSHKLIGPCTAYYPINPTTSTGMTAGYGVVAVDPSVIPYGTRMYIVSTDGSVVYGYCVAGDTGGAVLSGEILADLCFDTEEECYQIGMMDMIIYILG